MGSIGKRKVTVSGKDLKQAVLKKNKSLEAKNKAIESSLKNKEKELKSLDKEYSSESKKMGELLKDIIVKSSSVPSSLFILTWSINKLLIVSGKSL